MFDPPSPHFPCCASPTARLRVGAESLTPFHPRFGFCDDLVIDWPGKLGRLNTTPVQPFHASYLGDVLKERGSDAMSIERPASPASI